MNCNQTRPAYFVSGMLIFFFSFCSTKENDIIRFSAPAQGTTYTITYQSSEQINYQKQIDSLLADLDSSLSTYNPGSIISKVNKNDSSVLLDRYFIEVFKKAIEISGQTEGLFDVTVAPLINAYGFGFTKKEEVDSAMVDSLLKFVGYKMVKLEGEKIIKSRPELMLDFNAIAQGYSVDILAEFLESKGLRNYLVELGGEVRAKGKNKKDEFWQIGIDKPEERMDDTRPLEAVVGLKDAALATSGNYRKFYVENGKKYSHIIDPHTGYPARHNLLSATVVASNCITADAYATAFMVMGIENAKQFLSENKDLQLQVFFIYDEGGTWKTYMSEGLRDWIKKSN
jgi:thiamine biosynthesis lipoprotein